MTIQYAGDIKIRVPDKSTLNWDIPLGHNWRLIAILLGALRSSNRVQTGLELSFSGLALTWGSGDVELASTALHVATGSINATPSTVQFVYLDNAGTAQINEDVPVGDFIPIAMIESDATQITSLADLRPFGARQSSSHSFDNSDLTAGVLTFNHGLDVDYPASVTIYSDTKKIVEASEITSVDSNTIVVDLAAYGAITGTWHISIRS